MAFVVVTRKMFAKVINDEHGLELFLHLDQTSVEI